MQTLERIPVFFASDEHYAHLLATAISSMMENTSSFVDIYILDSGISTITKDKILETIKNYDKCKAEFIVLDMSKINEFPPEEHYISYAGYNRFLIPILGKKLKKVIYSDVDVIFCDDIKKLYEESLDDYVIGAVPDALYLLQENLNDFRTRLKISNEHVYFYSGLILMDTEKWLKNDITQKLFDIGQSFAGNILQGDQDILNICFENNYKKLNPKYEATNGYLLNAAKFDAEIQKDLKNIVLRHFESCKKPWNSIIEMADGNIFWEYAKKTKFYSLLYQNHKKLYNTIKYYKLKREVLKL